MICNIYTIMNVALWLLPFTQRVRIQVTNQSGNEQNLAHQMLLSSTQLFPWRRIVSGLWLPWLLVPVAHFPSSCQPAAVAVATPHPGPACPALLPTPLYSPRQGVPSSWPGFCPRGCLHISRRVGAFTDKTACPNKSKLKWGSPALVGRGCRRKGARISRFSGLCQIGAW